MTNPTNNPAHGAGSPVHVDYRILESVPAYVMAQEIVDRLSDNGFPVEKVRIVGNGLRSVEQITGRMTTGKAAGRGALAGMWFGLMIALLFLILAPGYGFLGILIWSLIFGAIWGAIFGAIGHAATGGRRDFSSVQGLEAASYDVLVEADHHHDAAQMLAGLPGQSQSDQGQWEQGRAE